MGIVIREVRTAEHRVGKRVYRQKTAHPPCVYPPRWPTGHWWCAVRISGQQHYLGVVGSVGEGIAVVAAFKRAMGVGAECADVPQPIDARRPPPPAVEPTLDVFGR